MNTAKEGSYDKRRYNSKKKEKKKGKRENWSGEGREWKRRVDADTNVQKQI